jgi:hypothetical protein
MALEANDKLVVQQRVMADIASRIDLARKMGYQYEDDRKVYKALGYPEDTNLTFQDYWKRYKRQDIAAAVIDRPTDATWKGDIVVVEADTERDESTLNNEWKNLNRQLKVKQVLRNLDKLTGIGTYGLLLFGFGDVSKMDDWKRPVQKAELKYIKPIIEEKVTIEKYEENSSSERYGKPLFYKINASTYKTSSTETTQITVHWSRVLHVVSGNLDGGITGIPRLHPILNRLYDLEKLMGGSAEMFWRGARPGYSINLEEGFEFTTDDQNDLDDELKAYENDLRRFIVSKGFNLNPLAMQVADPSNHIDIQLQAISAQTGIPKRILVGSERGELASSQDRDAWLELVKTRREEFAEPEILRAFVDYCMEHGVLNKVEEYNVHWEDLFSLSEDDRVRIGKTRAESLSAYGNSMGAQEVLPPEMIGKYLLGLTDDELEEFMEEFEEFRAKMIEEGDGLPEEEIEEE